MVSEFDTPEQAETQLPPEQPKKEDGDLSADFFQRLMHIPPCRTGGECNNCGRCEH